MSQQMVKYYIPHTAEICSETPKNFLDFFRFFSIFLDFSRLFSIFLEFSRIFSTFLDFSRLFWISEQIFDFGRSVYRMHSGQHDHYLTHKLNFRQF